jgi:internalin A
MKSLTFTYLQTTRRFFLKAVLTLLLGMLLPVLAHSQYILPDTNFRNKLLSDYPAVMTGNALNITAANNFTGLLNVSSANISNISGLQFFTKASGFNLNSNNLTSIPDISGCTMLTILYAQYNQLTSFPSISTFTLLNEFQVTGNQLTSLPSFSGLTNLINIYSNSNKLKSLPDISSLVNLQILVTGDNYTFDSLPDFSPLVSLKQLHINQTGVDTIKGLANLPNLEVLFAWGNRIRDLSSLNSNTKLKIFQVFDNELKALPNLANKPLLNYVSFIQNRLTFEDIIPLKPLSTFSIFDYSPQKQVILPPSYTVRERDNFSINLNIDPGVPTNWYAWYKNGTRTDSIQSGIKNIPVVSYADSGIYFVNITNPNLPSLVLTTTIADVIVKPCLEINSFTMNTTSENCTEGTNISFSSVNLGGGIGPYVYGIVSRTNTDTVSSSTPSFQGLTPGLYKMIVTDSRMCKAGKEVTIKTPAGCEPVFSPDGDGVMDTYFIQETGKVKIYDTKRNFITELNAPVLWDGTKSDGSLAEAGYYAIVINGKKIIHITLIR